MTLKLIFYLNNYAIKTIFMYTAKCSSSMKT